MISSSQIFSFPSCLRFVTYTLLLSLLCLAPTAYGQTYAPLGKKKTPIVAMELDNADDIESLSSLEQASYNTVPAKSIAFETLLKDFEDAQLESQLVESETFDIKKSTKQTSSPLASSKKPLSPLETVNDDFNTGYADQGSFAYDSEVDNNDDFKNLLNEFTTDVDQIQFASVESEPFDLRNPALPDSRPQVANIDKSGNIMLMEDAFNPVLYLRVNQAQASNIQINVYTNKGFLLFGEKTPLTIVGAEIEINHSDWPTGTAYMEVELDNGKKWTLGINKSGPVASID